MTDIPPSSRNEKTVSDKKYRNEIARKIIHMSSFFIVLFIYFADKMTACLATGLFFLLVFVGNSVLLYSKFRFLNDIKVKYFSFLLRDNEKYGYISSNWFLLGCFLSVLLFSKYIAMLGITVLIFGTLLPRLSVSGSESTDLKTESRLREHSLLSASLICFWRPSLFF